MHPDHPVDDELQPRQADTGIGYAAEVERAVGIGHVHHDLQRRLGHAGKVVALHAEFEFIRIDMAGFALGTGHGDFAVVRNRGGRVAASHHRRNAEFTGNDGRVAGASAAVGDDGGSAFHDRFPVRVCHVGDQYIARLHFVHILE